MSYSKYIVMTIFSSNCILQNEMFMYTAEQIKFLIWRWNMIISMEFRLWVNSFDALLKFVLLSLKFIKGKKTIVFGKISDPDPEKEEENMERIFLKGVELSKQGWVVLDITSFLIYIGNHFTLDPGYPFAILEHFTEMLIKLKIFDTIHFLDNYTDSVGALAEYNTAIKCGIPIVITN